MSGKQLERELAAYEAIKDDLLAQGCAGKWIVIVGDNNVGIFDDPAVAYAKGIEEAGLSVPFLLKQIGEDDHASVPAFTLGVLNADY